MQKILQWLKSLIFFSIIVMIPTGYTKAANLCNSGTEIFIGAYHSSIVSTKDDFFAFGEAIAANGTSNNLTPVSIIPANGYNYTGDLLFATDATHDTQAFILTTDGLYVWGASGANTAASHETAIVTGVAFHSIDMPVGILPTDVTYLTATNGGVFLVSGGKVYAQGITPDLMGDNGAAADANGWHTVQKSSGGNLTNVKFFKANYNGALAVTTTNEYYTWGTAVFLGNGTSSQTLTSATLMTAPFAGSASIIAVTGYDVTPGLSYYVLNPADTKVYVLGGNSDGQLGIGSNGNTSTTWTTVKKSAGVDLVGVIDINADDNSDHYPTAGAIVNGYNGNNEVFLVWGRNSSNALGAGTADIVYPYVPTGFIPGTSRATKIEMGGHTTMYYDPDYIDTLTRKGKMCYIGHKINGSMGDGVASSSTVSSFECDDTPWLPTLCAAEKPPIATDDDKIDQPSGVVTLNVVTTDNGHGIDSDPDGTVDASTVDLTPLTDTIDQTLVVSGEGTWSVDATGLVTFTPDVALVGDPTDISYTVQDNNGIESNTATIHITYIRLISIDDVNLIEGNSGNTNMTFTISIDAPSATDINVTYTTSDGSATTADSDYVSTTGIATIIAGATTTTINVPVTGDITVEGDDDFTVDLSNPAGATILDVQGLGTITNDDYVAQSITSVTSDTQTEGTDLNHTVTLSGASAIATTYPFTLDDNTTDSATDYGTSTFSDGVTLSGGMLTVPAGVTSFTIITPTTNDTVDENDEFYDLTVGGVAATGTILDNDYTPSIEVIKTASITAGGGEGYTITYTFTVINTGNIALNNVKVDDARIGLANLPVADLAIGERDTVTADYMITIADLMDGNITNQAMATGTPPVGLPVTDLSDDNVTAGGDDPTVTLLGLIRRGITLEKTGTFMDENNDGYVDIGETINYEFNVTNTGNVILYDVNITDDNAVITGGPISLIPGESDTTTFTGVHTVTWQDIVDGAVLNQAVVTAKDSQGNDVNDTSDDPQNPVDDDINSDGDPDDETYTGLPIEPPTSTNDTESGTTGENVTIDVIDNDAGGTFNLDATTVTLTPPAGAINIVTDADGDTIGFVVPGEGTWSVDETTGEVTFSPENGYVGDPTPIEYTIEDTQGNETTAEISINYPPVANDDNVSLEEGETAIFLPLSNDQNTSSSLDPERVSLVAPNTATDVITDLDGDIIGLTMPNEGVWSVDETTGEVTFIPDVVLTGDPTPINYTVREVNGDISNEAVLSVSYKQMILTLNAFCENDVPYISYDIQLIGLDPTGETATMTWTSADGNFTEVESDLPLNNTHHLWAGTEINSEGNGTVWPGWNELPDGTWEIVYSDWRRWNPDQSDATLSVTLSVNPESTVTVQYPPASILCSANPPASDPLATDNLNILITEYRPTVIDVLANGDSWGLSGPGTESIIFTQPIYGTVDIDDGGTPDDPTDDILIYIPAPDVNNVQDSFIYTITDALGVTSTANVTLDVNCASSQSSDSGDALDVVSMLLLAIMTAMTGLYFIRKEEERGEA